MEDEKGTVAAEPVAEENATTDNAVQELYEIADAVRDNLERVIVGKNEVIELVLAGLFGGGNILLEDVPGVGKTTLAKALAKSLHVDYTRIQFTPDMLPSDILGGSIFNPQTGEFTFRKGPVFTNILLADEINRASPRTQSALLEAMTERQATVEGVTHEISKPFLVIATQNPVEYHGTYPLPEAQLDRFMLRLEIGYPAMDQETRILLGEAGEDPLQEIVPVAHADRLLEVQAKVHNVTVTREMADYIVRLMNATRHDDRFRLGASPRASLMLQRAAQALAFLSRRDFVTPDDVKRAVEPVVAHRLVIDSKARYGGAEKLNALQDIIKRTDVPL